MRELKTESQSNRTTQTQPGLKKSTPRTVEDCIEQHETIELQSALNSEIDPSAEETPAKRGRKPPAKQTAGKAKRSTTPKAKQITSTQVKLTWEAPESSERTPFGIAVRFQQLEHELTQLKSQANQINQQSVEIQTEMEALRTIAQQSALSPVPETPQPRKPSGPSMPSFMQSPARPARSTASPDQASLEQTTPPPVESLPSVSPGASSDRLRATRQEFPRTVPQKPMAAATRATLKSLKNPAPPSRRRRSLRHSLNRFAPSLGLPKPPIARLLDALLWTLAAAGLRIGLSFLVEIIPVLAMPIGALMFVPAIVAAYLAFFVPRSSPVLLYRLLLVTLGLFIGGKL
ncbi:hypothetical protein ACKFKG_29980 [Phormidesmis sp. 146-35]